VRRIKFVTAAFVATLTLAALLFLVSPFFHVREVVIQGNSRISQAEIRSHLEASYQTHIMFFNANAARRRVLENPYIGDVVIRREMPGTLHITVSERRLTAYVEHMPGSFLFLDDFGRVLEIRNYMTDQRPLLEGLQFTRFQLGEMLEVPDAASFGVVVHYAQLLNHHGLINRVTSMNVSDSSDIRILINYIEFKVGGVNNADEKIRTIIAILDEMPNVDTARGFVHMQEIARDIIFEILQ